MVSGLQGPGALEFVRFKVLRVKGFERLEILGVLGFKTLKAFKGFRV